MSFEEIIGLLQGLATILGIVFGAITPVFIYLTKKWRLAEAETKKLLANQNEYLVDENERLQRELVELNRDAIERAERFAETASTWARIIENIRNAS